MDLFVRHEARGALSPVIASLPHSGVFVPPGIAERFTPEHLAWLRNTDWFLPELYSFLPELGVTMLEATHSRYVADLNRDPERRLFGPFFEAVVAERSAQGRAIYQTAPEEAELGTRVARFHEPYHQALRALIDQRRAAFPRVLLLDLHSYMVPTQHEVCLGDARGTTCAPEMTARFESAFRAEGFDAVTNQPYTGGFVVRSQHALPSVSALQIELRYPLYMDCSRIDEPIRPTVDSGRIAELQPRLKRAIEHSIAAFLAV
jgi:N-formylglutamate deformylase